MSCGGRIGGSWTLSAGDMVPPASDRTRGGGVVKLRWRQCRRAGVRGLAGLSLVALVAWLTPAVAAGASTAPINDSYLESLVITQASTTGQGGIYHDVEDTSLATTQNDLFDPDPFGTVTSGGGREPTSCDGRSYGNTIWYD